MSDDVVNLNRFRKKKTLAEGEKRAAENRVKFGRTRAEKQRADAERDRTARGLDGRKIDE